MKELQKDTLMILDLMAPVAFQAFGARAQYLKAIEELSELTQLLCKQLNGAPVTQEQMVDEVADVLVMAGQLRWNFGPDEVDNRMLFKLDRTRTFINRLPGTSSETI